MDAQLFEAYKALRVPSVAKSVRQDYKTLNEKKGTFLKTREIPTFTYEKAGRVSVQNYLKRLERFKRLLANSTLNPIVRELYEEKVRELEIKGQLIIAVQQEDDAKVSTLSGELHSFPKTSLETVNAELEERLRFAETFHLHRNPIDADQFSKMVEVLLARYDIADTKIARTVRKTIRISHTSTDKQTIYIPHKLKLSRSRARRVLTHEIEGHLLRRANAYTQPLHLLRVGLSGYMATEEGIATYLQKKADTHEKRFDPGFWDLFATVLTKTNDFNGVFDALYSAKLRLLEKQGVEDAKTHAEDSAWTLCLRAYRGIRHPNTPGLGYYRDHLYREGFSEVREAITQNPRILSELFIGKVSLRHLPKLKELRLSNSRVPKLLAGEVVKLIRERERRA